MKEYVMSNGDMLIVDYDQQVLSIKVFTPQGDLIESRNLSNRALNGELPPVESDEARKARINKHIVGTELD